MVALRYHANAMQLAHETIAYAFAAARASARTARERYTVVLQCAACELPMRAIARFLAVRNA